LCCIRTPAQDAAAALAGTGVRRGVVDIVGGVTAWREQVDPSFPL
jgi:hypothetical protein